MIKIQDRDKKIAQGCYEQQTLNTKSVQEAHFKEANRSEAYRRVQELIKAGYLKRVKPFPGSTQTVIVLTEKGHALARQESRWEIPYRPRLNPATLGHDLHVTEVRLRLEQLWKALWVPEAVLKHRAGKERHPDAAIGDGLMIFDSDRIVAIEVENSLKSKERYLKIWENWSKAKPKPFLVLCVATEEGIYRKLKAFLSEAPKGQAFGLVLLADLLKNPPPKLWTVAGEFDIFSKREL